MRITGSKLFSSSAHQYSQIMRHNSVVQSFSHSQSSTIFSQKRQVRSTLRVTSELKKLSKVWKGWKRSAKNNKDPHLALLAYRATPLECGKSPAELLFGRQLLTTLPNVQHHQNAKLKERKRKKDGWMLFNDTSAQFRKTKRYYTQSAKPLKPLPTNTHLSDYIPTDHGNRNQQS